MISKIYYRPKFGATLKFRTNAMSFPVQFNPHLTISLQFWMPCPQMHNSFPSIQNIVLSWRIHIMLREIWSLQWGRDHDFLLCVTIKAARIYCTVLLLSLHFRTTNYATKFTMFVTVYVIQLTFMMMMKIWIHFADKNVIKFLQFMVKICGQNFATCTLT